ncbi:hypothetical protein BOTBODRAFT_33537 [Botryobasidium botryosum FD-172 SS1]|uniref:Uncharacterized protein n=1 Tax=Botryobasidium botryosum (strain FD-172 SS1) TaxID=930990 RepID=A0A067MFN8_BOTB1|nr:hypothetical protein BOTBODRAFT_33537 [Botryobasidium botryosum FD-172 SS1]
MSDSAPTDPLDIFSGSLESLYDELQVSYSEPGKLFSYRGVTVSPPDTASENWSLHASSIWRASLFLTDHLPILDGPEPVHIIELGAGSGLPGICAALEHPGARVVLSDYPDPHILSTLAENVRRNQLREVRVKVVGYAWGSDLPSELIPHSFDVVMAADTLWMPEQHANFSQTLALLLKKTIGAKVYLVAGLHTGRWMIAEFMRVVATTGLGVQEIKEVSLINGEEREWKAERENEDDTKRRRWIIRMTLSWATLQTS